jgi:flagellar basal-body rod modification protein FlgD
MTIQPTQTTRADATAPVPPNPSSEMGKEAFLKLLVAELKNQDPMDPMQSRDMVAQLATLSSVEKLGGIDTKLGELQATNAANTGLQSAGLIGHNVTGDTSRLSLTSTSNPQGSYELQGKANQVAIQVRDAGGNVVRTITSGAQRLGPQQFLWDGKTDGGTRAPDGSYTFEVAAQDDKGIPVAATTAVSGLVTQITYEGGVPKVVVGGARIPLADITSIAQ